LTERAFPGFADPNLGDATFVEKYGEDREAIALSMLDYIRSTNFADHQLQANNQFSILCPGVEHEGFGQIAPLQERIPLNRAASSNHPQGMGRVLTISEVALVISCRAEVDPQGVLRGEPSDQGREQLKNPGDRELEVSLLVETFLPGQGWVDYRSYATVAMVGGAAGAAPNLRDELPEMRLNGKVLVPEVRTVTTGEMPPAAWHGAGGSLGVRALSHGVLQFQPVVIPVEAGGQVPKVDFKGTTGEVAQLKLALYDAPQSTGAADLLQVVPLQLPDIPMGANLALPRLVENLEPSLKSRLAQTVRSGAGALFAATDVVQSLAPLHGDYRLTAMQRWVESRKSGAAMPVFAPNPNWGMRLHAHNLRDAVLMQNGEQTQGYLHRLEYAPAFRPDMPDSLAEDTPRIRVWESGNWQEYQLGGALDALRLDGGRRGLALPEFTGDFDNGIANAPDGPYGNRPDDGHAAALAAGVLPYFTNLSQTGPTVPPVSLALFSPQRVMPSAVMFGSLPTGTRSHVPWQTLLFRPHPEHYGRQNPPDHLWLDLFWMPVLEPEPISVNLATKGKINLNTEMLPFRHIRRDTALHAVLKAEAITAIPDRTAATYKNGLAADERFRHFIDARATLELMRQEVFGQGEVFLTSSQICEHYLIPEGVVAAGETPRRSQMESFWAEHRLTGDNSKERPYAHIYPKLTTRSNVFRIHFVAQAIKKARSVAADRFDAGRDKVTAAVRGSAVASRELNLNHPRIPNYQQAPAEGVHPPLDRFYRWHLGSVEPDR
jgi:hypothetical protein